MSHIRSLLRSPGFSLVVVLTLSLGIGATTSIFSFLHGVLLRPMSYPDPERIVVVCETSPEQLDAPCVASPANWLDWRRLSRTIETFGLARDWPFGVRQEGTMRGVSGGIATPGFFQAFEVRPALGRVFDSRDIESGHQFVAVISDRFRQSWFGGGDDVVGRRIEIDGQPYDVIGALPPGFSVPRLSGVDIWIPIWPERLASRSWRGFLSFGRLADGATLAQARAEMSSIRDSLAREYPETNAAWEVRVETLHERTVSGVRPALLVFLAAVLAVLLITCANVAHLVLARNSTREREFAVRLALGAGRWRLALQLLLEGLVLAMCGAVFGVIGAYWAVDAISALAPAWFPRLETVHLDGSVLMFTLAVTASTSLLFSLAPALYATRVNLSEALRGTGGPLGRRGAMRAREILVVAEIAMACLLLVGAGLLLRSFGSLLDWRPGFDRRNLVLVRVVSHPGEHSTTEPVADLFRRGVEEIRGLPSVVAAGAGSATPLFGGGDGTEEFIVEGRPEPSPGLRPSAFRYYVDWSYFRTLGVPLVRGRLFTEADRADAPQVAIINETLARRYFPGADPIGQRVRMLMHESTFEIVGVVGDVRPFRPDEAPDAKMYWPFSQDPHRATVLIARTAGPPAAVMPAIRSRLQSLDPGLEIGRMSTMDDLVVGELVNPRFNLTLVGLFALVAAAIAMVGVYGVVSFSIAQRTREIGVRMALGAQPRSILKMVLGRGLALAAAGLLAGLIAAFWLTRLLRVLLAGVAPADPPTFAVIPLLLLLAALAACWVPARRAARIEPVEALRHE